MEMNCERKLKEDKIHNLKITKDFKMILKEL
jgi:hypothetical protein